MNCLRSLKYIKQLDKRYKKQGLKTMLIHTPEWSFEKNKKNIQNAIKKYKIKFPTKFDNDKKIIKRLKVNFWPTQILIKNKKIVYKHIGEGNYKKLEHKIIDVLKIETNPLFNSEPKYSTLPVVYAGKKKHGRISKLKDKFKFGIIYLKGDCKQNNESLIVKGSVSIKTKGKIISFVAKSLNKKPVNVKIRLNNELIKNIIINTPQLYNIIRLNNDESKILNLETESKLAIYSFTFR